MTKICYVKSEIKDLKITMDKIITIQVLNFLNSSFAQLFDVLGHKTRTKKQFPILESFAKLLENKKL